MIKKGDFLPGVITAGSNSTRLFSVSIGNSEPLENVTSLYPLDNYVQGQDVILTFLHDGQDSPRIISPGFRSRSATAILVNSEESPEKMGWWNYIFHFRFNRSSSYPYVIAGYWCNVAFATSSGTWTFNQNQYVASPDPVTYVAVTETGYMYNTHYEILKNGEATETSIQTLYDSGFEAVRNLLIAGCDGWIAACGSLPWNTGNVVIGADTGRAIEVSLNSYMTSL